ncbi:MAG: cupin domain-containing protein [Nitrospirae bacterium]|nr:cupin domain-containing protein [Nitrospirota bacterium]
MKKAAYCIMSVLFVILALGFAAKTAMAEDVAPSYKASPEVYKVIAENEHFRVVIATWKPGQRDAMHSHEGPLVGYRLTDCNLKVYTPDGKATAREAKRGEALFNPVIAAHAVENVGTSDCQLVIVEKK